MKKPFSFKEKTDKVCSAPGCSVHLKKNLLAKNPNATLCYEHWQKFVRKSPKLLRKLSQRMTLKNPAQ